MYTIAYVIGLGDSFMCGILVCVCMCEKVRGERDTSSIFRFPFTSPAYNLNIINLSAATRQLLFHNEAEDFSH